MCTYLSNVYPIPYFPLLLKLARLSGLNCKNVICTIIMMDLYNSLQHKGFKMRHLMYNNLGKCTKILSRGILGRHFSSFTARSANENVRFAEIPPRANDVICI